MLKLPAAQYPPAVPELCDQHTITLLACLSYTQLTLPSTVTPVVTGTAVANVMELFVGLTVPTIAWLSPVEGCPL